MEPAKYTVIGFAPQMVDEQCKRIRADFGISRAEILAGPKNIILKDVAHIALKRTCYLREGVSEDDLVSVLAHFSFSTLQIFAQTVRVFEKTEFGNVVYISVELGSELQNLHKALYDLFAPFAVNKNDKVECDGFLSHITVSYLVPDEVVGPMSKRVAYELLPVNFSLSTLTLLRGVNSATDERRTVLEICAR